MAVQWVLFFNSMVDVLTLTVKGCLSVDRNCKESSGDQVLHDERQGAMDLMKACSTQAL
jgi:hypothetical protein